ncbi:unnamed protein product [Ambrosiozyma monospora]|uniref:Unnamed protein product n=1 Tax=Ambrosiozyma monospora TaxID=43982 RepID=A0A9W6YNC7_AMBMO|nr:unnamed protein product [Ambrosiozyma monospora]
MKFPLFSSSINTAVHVTRRHLSHSDLSTTLKQISAETTTQSTLDGNTLQTPYKKVIEIATRNEKLHQIKDRPNLSVCDILGTLKGNLKKTDPTFEEVIQLSQNKQFEKARDLISRLKMKSWLYWNPLLISLFGYHELKNGFELLDHITKKEELVPTAETALIIVNASKDFKSVKSESLETVFSLIQKIPISMLSIELCNTIVDLFAKSKRPDLALKFVDTRMGECEGEDRIPLDETTYSECFLVLSSTFYHSPKKHAFALEKAEELYLGLLNDKHVIRTPKLIANYCLVFARSDDSRVLARAKHLYELFFRKLNSEPLIPDNERRKKRLLPENFDFDTFLLGDDQLNPNNEKYLSSRGISRIYARIQNRLHKEIFVSDW